MSETGMAQRVQEVYIKLGGKEKCRSLAITNFDDFNYFVLRLPGADENLLQAVVKDLKLMPVYIKMEEAYAYDSWRATLGLPPLEQKPGNN